MGEERIDMKRYSTDYLNESAKRANKYVKTSVKNV